MRALQVSNHNKCRPIPGSMTLPIGGLPRCGWPIHPPHPDDSNLTHSLQDNWTYTGVFQVPKAFLDFGSRVVLVAKGLDTVATVSIGGSALTPAVDNMFRTWVWDVTDHVQE